MKYIALVVAVAVLMFSGIAFADQTGKTLWHSHSYTDKDSYVDRYSEYQEKQNMQLGVGADVVCYRFDGIARDYGLESINTEYKYDVANDNHSVYVMTHYDLWGMIGKYIE